MSASGDNVYLNLVINNPIDNTTRTPIYKIASYNQTLPAPVLNNPRDYYASIIRFSCPVNSIPITVFPLDTSPGQTNANKSNLLIGVRSSGADFDSYIMYTPANDLPAPQVISPTTTFTFTQSTEPYYFIYSITQFLAMINSGLAAAFVSAGSPGGVAPFYIYDPLSQLFSLIVDSSFVSAGAEIYMNAALQIYLSSFPFITQNNINTGPYLFFHDLSVVPYGQTSPFKYSQEYISNKLWLAAANIVMTTSSIPILQEASPAFTPSSFNPNGLATSIPIISDYVLTFNTIADIASIITYIPSAQYRLNDLASSGPLNRFDLQFNWLSKSGIMYPIFIAPGQSASLKIIFPKKELYKNF